MELFERVYADYQKSDGELFRECFDQYGSQWGHQYIDWAMAKAKAAKVKLFHYLVTFTVDPKKDFDKDKVESFIHMQPKRTALQTKTAYVAQETTKAGQPHWHMYIVTTKALRSDAFKYYQDRYGNVDISRSKYNNEADALSYITKESDPIKLI